MTVDASGLFLSSSTAVLCDDNMILRFWRDILTLSLQGLIGGCEVAVTARTRCWWVQLRQCVEPLYGIRFPLMLNGAVCKSYVKPASLYENEAW